MSQKKTIVLVEDDQWLADSYAAVLKKYDYEVHHAPHVLAAIDIIDQHQPAAIVLDVLLAGSTAFTLLHELQSHTDLAAIPVILVTNLASDIPLDDVRAYGVTSVLDKANLVPEDIVTVLRRVEA